MIYIVCVVLVVALLAVKYHVTTVAGVKTAVSAEVTKLEASLAKVEPVIKADLSAIVANIKALL